MVIELVNQFGPKRWSVIASHLKGRIGKQCRERYALKPLLRTQTSQSAAQSLSFPRSFGLAS